MDILFIGTARPGTTCDQRYRAMQDMGHTVRRIDMRPDGAMKIEQTIWYRACRKWIRPLDLAGVNRQILQASTERRFDVLWLEKALTVHRETLRAVRRRHPDCLIIGYSPDDMAGNPANRSPQFISHLPCYDVFFTTKSFGVNELAGLGCPCVRFNPNAYDRNTHQHYPPMPGDRERLGGAVGFIGAWEPERDQTLLHLASQGIQVRIWGGGWQRSRLNHPNLIVEKKPLWGEDYARAIGSFDINLNFLRRVNRDLQTQRSVEIPACGGFMLTERTDEHLALFEEDKEAAYFSDEAELLTKIRHYLAHPRQRHAIAAAARQRCLSGGYSYHERIETMLREALALRQAHQGLH